MRSYSFGQQFPASRGGFANHHLAHRRAAADLLEHSSLWYDIGCYVNEISAAKIVLPTVTYFEMNIVQAQCCHKLGRHLHTTRINIQTDIMDRRKMVVQPQECCREGAVAHHGGVFAITE